MSQFDLNAFIAIISIVVTSTVTILVGCRNISRKTLRYSLESVPLIEGELSKTQQYTITVNRQPANSLVKTSVSFKNTGNSQINASDFSETMPLRIIAENKIFHPENGYVVKSSDPDSITLNMVNEKTMEIIFKYIKPAQTISIELLHDGNLSVSGELKTGKMRYKSFPNLASLVFMFTVSLLFSILAYGMCFFTLFHLSGDGNIFATVYISLLFCLIWVSYVCFTINHYHKYTISKKYHNKKSAYPNQ